MPSIRDALKANYFCSWADHDSTAKTSVKTNAQQFPTLRNYEWHGYDDAGFDAAIRNRLGTLTTKDNEILAQAYQQGEQVPELIHSEADVERFWNRYLSRVLVYAARRYAKLKEGGQLQEVQEMSKAGPSGPTAESTTVDAKMSSGRQDINIIEFKKPWVIRTAEWGMANQEGSSARKDLARELRMYDPAQGCASFALIEAQGMPGSITALISLYLMAFDICIFSF